MTVVGLDDTDSRERGMCTTYVGARIAARLREEGTVARLLLIRLNPAVEHKTRGNAAVAIHTDVSADRSFDAARTVLDRLAIADDDRTNPGLVVADRPVPDSRESGNETAIDDEVAAFTRRAIRDHLSIPEATSRIERAGFRQRGWGNGRGRIGALAAIGAWDALEEWTVERIAYRNPERWGTAREVESDSLRTAAERAYPAVWDTIDRGTGELVCVPRTPGPVLAGIRGDDAEAVDEVADAIEGEPVATSQRFLTNQGTDVHLRDGELGALEDGYAYRVDGTVLSEPETREGGHVFVTITEPRGADGDGGQRPGSGGRDTAPEPATVSVDEAATHTRECVAFEPTKRFRDRVRALRPGDRVTVCGEVARGTLKLEKFAVRDLRRYDRVTPTCPACERTMESAGRGQGYRCRDCDTRAPGRDRVELDRDLEPGWYEVPPRARRHVAKPLVRGGFDAPTHPER